MLTPQILKSVNFTKTQKSRYLGKPLAEDHRIKKNKIKFAKEQPLPQANTSPKM